MKRNLIHLAVPILTLVIVSTVELAAQGGYRQEHRRGRLWEIVMNDGFIGSLAAWDYGESGPMGLFPGFEGYTHPTGGEQNAYDFVFENANMHNFRSGCWIVIRDSTMAVPGIPPAYTPVPTLYEAFLSGLQSDTYGAENVREDVALIQNFAENPGYDSRLPEEMTKVTFNTNTGISITRRSYVWSYPGYNEFIIYDYVFRNTGRIVANSTGEVVPNFPQQTLHNVYFVFHSGIAVSTKSQINFHDELFAVAAGGFGWQPPSYHDVYHIDDNNTLVYSTNVNGGREPTEWDTYIKKSPDDWLSRFGPELESPSAFGWLALYASPTTGSTPRPSPRPDVLRVDSHKGGVFQGKDLNLEAFVYPGTGMSKKKFYDFATTPDTQKALGNIGKRMNFYTISYGPYTLAPGDSARFILAEIAGVMDYNVVNAGDSIDVKNPVDTTMMMRIYAHYFPDSTVAAIRRNAVNARSAVAWGLGASVGQVPLAAAVPAPPPGPKTEALNASKGTDTAIIKISWDRTSENVQMTDAGGNIYYRGLADLDGYRVYRSTDFQYVSAEEPPTFRGAAWKLLVDIPKSDFARYEDAATGGYQLFDSAVAFGFKYGYYVSAYRKAGATWTSPNGQVITSLPELASGDYNRTPPAPARPGPAVSFDIFVVPNPYIYNDPQRSFGRTAPYELQFYNLPERCVLRIYTLAGDLVKTLNHEPDARGNKFGSESWDQKSESGLLVAPGLYVYHVQSTTLGVDGTFTGKLMIIR